MWLDLFFPPWEFEYQNIWSRVLFGLWLWALVTTFFGDFGKSLEKIILIFCVCFSSLPLSLSSLFLTLLLCLSDKSGRQHHQSVFTEMSGCAVFSVQHSRAFFRWHFCEHLFLAFCHNSLSNWCLAQVLSGSLNTVFLFLWKFKT